MRLGSIAGTILLDREESVGRLSIQLQNAAFQRQPNVVSTEDGAVAVDFRLADVPPGATTLRVGVRSDAEPAVEIADLEVRPGEVCLDPRLQPIDLRGRVRSIEIRVVDAAERPMASARVMVLRRGRRTSLVESTDADGRARLETAATSVDLIVSQNGHRVLYVPGVTESKTVRLEPTIPARVSVVTGEPMPEGCERLVVTLSLVRRPPIASLADFKWTIDRKFRLGDLSRQEIGELHFAGRYRVEVQAVSRTEGAVIGVGGPGGSQSLGSQEVLSRVDVRTREVDVLDTRDLVPIEIRLADGALGRAVRPAR